MPETPKSGGRTALLMVVIAVVILSPLAYSIVSSLFAHEAQGQDVVLEKPAPEHKKCVRETAYMRYHHWELLREIREEVVRYGKRGEVGLFMCKDCHTSRDKFCNQCHNAASVYPDCYGCHYYP
jgi:hypothetical protein